VKRWRHFALSKLESPTSESVTTISLTNRIEFETTQLKSTRERLAVLQATFEREEGNERILRQSQQDIERQLEKLQAEIDRQCGKLAEATQAYEEATKSVEEQRDRARKTQKQLDKALKEIASWNDEIEKSDSDRHAIYRRCRLEEIDLPLVSGRLDKVPIEEVRPLFAILADSRKRVISIWRWTMMGPNIR